MFEKCCGCRSSVAYEITHNPKPISLSYDMDEIIKNLLWYAPNIDSYQAGKNELIQDKLYDDFSFTYILNYMKMDEKKDVKWIEPRDSFDDDEWNYFVEGICCNCQKIIITRQKNLSKTNDLLRCLRNSIAHGHFAIVDDYIICFNKNNSKTNPDGIRKAVIKIKPKLLLDALKLLASPKAKEQLLAYAFRRIGYNISRELDSQKWRFDLLLEKDGKKYVIEIKDYVISSSPKHRTISRSIGYTTAG